MVGKVGRTWKACKGWNDMESLVGKLERSGGHGMVWRTWKGWEDMERLGGHVKVGRI